MKGVSFLVGFFLGGEPLLKSWGVNHQSDTRLQISGGLIVTEKRISGGAGAMLFHLTATLPPKKPQKNQFIRGFLKGGAGTVDFTTSSTVMSADD